MLVPDFVSRLRHLLDTDIPRPGGGGTAERHRLLFGTGRSDLSLARLAEAHWDALAILAEASRTPHGDAIYGVWAAERAGEALTLEERPDGFAITGVKRFCSGAGLVNRALVTVTAPQALLIDVDLERDPAAVSVDHTDWVTDAFAETKTAAVTFTKLRVARTDILGQPRWYLDRPGFWHGALGPAACWAGGAAGLVDFALQQTRNDAHALAHIGAMYADLYAMESSLERAGDEIDAAPNDRGQAVVRALAVRHIVEGSCSDILRRLGRAFGPHPLAMNAAISRRYRELELYIRQCHAERDLEALGRALRTPTG